MKYLTWIVRAGLLGIVVFLLPSRAVTQPDPSSLVIRGGNLIDVRTGDILPDSIIVIEGDRITAVGSSGVVEEPADAAVIEADGQYILPGLWDAHAHTRDFDGILNINHGVTSTIDMGNILDWIHVLAEARAKQKAFGPRIFAQGMSIGGSLGPHQWNVKTPEEARWAARQNIEAGASILKVYRNADLEMMNAVVEEADKAGLNVIGHGGKTDAREAILAGVDGFAHGAGIAAATSPPEAAARMKRRDPALRGELGSTMAVANYLQDPAMFDDLIALMVERNVRIEPDIVQVFRVAYPRWDEYQLQNYRLMMNPDLYPLLPQMFVRMWATDLPWDPYPPKPEQLKKLRKGYENNALFLRKFAAAGGKVLVGTDAYYHMIPGLALWQEMQLLADMGLSPLQILRGATIYPAEYVKQDSVLGTVETGKLADLVILDENPLEDIANIRSLSRVIQHGKVQPLGYRLTFRTPIPRPYQRVNNELPRPYISSVQPSAIAQGTAGARLVIKGRDFNEENRVLWEDRDLEVLDFSETELTAAVPPELLRIPGTYKIHMITGGRVHQASFNFQDVMVTYGKTFEQRWNGQKLSIEF